LELQVAQKRREQQWRDRLGHRRQVEHALLDINNVLPATTGDAVEEPQTAPV